MSLFNFDNFGFGYDYLDSNVINYEDIYPMSPSSNGFEQNWTRYEEYFREGKLVINDKTPLASPVAIENSNHELSTPAPPTSLASQVQSLANEKNCFESFDLLDFDLTSLNCFHADITHKTSPSNTLDSGLNEIFTESSSKTSHNVSTENIDGTSSSPIAINSNSKNPSDTDSTQDFDFASFFDVSLWDESGEFLRSIKDISATKATGKPKDELTNEGEIILVNTDSDSVALSDNYISDSTLDSEVSIFDTNPVDTNTIDTNTVDANTIDKKTVDTDTIDTKVSSTDTSVASSIHSKLFNINNLFDGKTPMTSVGSDICDLVSSKDILELKAFNQMFADTISEKTASHTKSSHLKTESAKKKYGGKRIRSVLPNDVKIKRCGRFKVNPLFADIVSVQLTTANCMSCKINYSADFLGANCHLLDERSLINTAFKGPAIHGNDMVCPIRHISNSEKRTKYSRDLTEIKFSITNIKYIECQGFDHFHPYKPQWVRYELDDRGKEIPNSKSGLCPYCQNVKFYGLRNSGYMSHLATEHGIYSNSYLVPDGLNFGEYQVGSSRHHALECPDCHQLVNVSCQKGKNELLNYFRHWRTNHKNSDFTNLDVKITDKTRTTVPVCE